MPNVVTNGGMCRCAFSATAAPIKVTSQMKLSIEGKPVATICDNQPYSNLGPFGMCTNPANPAVAAAMGAPQPCTPMTGTPWMGANPKDMAGNYPILTDTCTTMCAYGGTITIDSAGQVKTQNQ